MESGKVKVLYIAGVGRSGSTILGNVLGQIDGFFHGGELRHIWDRSMVENWYCGCGLLFKECEIWRAVLQEAFGGADRIDPVEMTRLREMGTRTHHIPLMLVPRGKQMLKSRVEKYLENLEKLYQAIQHTTGSRVIVDSSNFPAYGSLLSTIPSVDLYVVNLVRDSRAVANSWLRKRLRSDAGTNLRDPVDVQQHRDTPLKSALRWDASSLGTEMLWSRSPDRYMTLRYEDFVTGPQTAVESILEMLDIDSMKGLCISAQNVELDVTHTVFGNPNRLQKGKVELRLDEGWQTEMKLRDKAMVTALTWPLLLKYGYLSDYHAPVRRAPVVPEVDNKREQDLDHGDA